MSKTNRYDKMTTDDECRLLEQVVNDYCTCPSGLLTIPEVADLLRECFNNDVLKAWDAEQEAAKQTTEE